MIAVMIVPTGIGAEIGGHEGSRDGGWDMKRAIGFWMLGMLLGMPVAATANTATYGWCVPVAIVGVAWILFAVRLIEGGKIEPPKLTDAELRKVRCYLEQRKRRHLWRADNASEQLPTNIGGDSLNVWPHRGTQGLP